MKKRNSSLIILSILIVIIALLSVYRISEYKGQENNNIPDKTANNTINENNNTINKDINNTKEKDVNLGDSSITGCATETSNTSCTCSSGTLNGQYCYSDINTTAVGYCPGYSVGSYCYTTRTNASCTTTTTCTACNDNFHLTDTGTCECNDYYYLNDSGTCSKCKISVEPSKKLISPGTKWWALVTYNNAQCGASGKPQPTFDTPDGSNSKTALVSETCLKSKITVTYGDSSKTVKVSVAGDWRKVEDGFYPRDMVKTRSEADASIVTSNDEPKMEYGKCDEVVGPSGEVLYSCKSVWQRGTCGSTRKQSYEYCCVNNQYVGVSSSVKWTGDENNGNGVLVNHNQQVNGKYGCAYYYGDNYTYVDVPKEKCIVPDDVPGRCSTNSVALNKVDEETVNCEENHKIKLFEGEKCTGTDLGSVGTDINTSFYSISCEREINTNFDYGDDNDTKTVRELYRGQGFKFGINVTTKVRCDGNFYKDRWKNVYNKLWNKIENVESGLVNACNDFNEAGLTRCENYINGMHFNREDTKKDVFTLLTIIRELVEIVDTYNNYAPNMEYNEGAKINFNYTINGKQSTKVVDEVFNKNVVSEGVYKTTSESTVNLGVPGITNPKNYVKSNYGQPRVIKFTFNDVYLDKTDGSIKVNPKEKLDGGNKIYIDYNADVQTISINSPGIVVTGLAGNNSSVTDNKCTIKIKDKDIIYRPIDVSNPFINNKWTPGENWINSQFDFRGVIHSDIWSSSCYSKYSNGVWRKCS